MKLKFSNGEYRMISDVTPITDRPAANRSSGMMKASRNIRTKLCSMAVLIIFAAVMLAVCILPASALTCDCDICVNETGWWCDNGALNGSSIPIQAAVNAASSGETIYVYNGSYTENVNVNKRVTLQGEGADVVTVSAALATDHVFEVTADYVNISGFKVTVGTRFSDKAGIYLSSRQHCNIINNTASSNFKGIYLDSSSNNNMLMNNTASSNFEGIYLDSSSNNNMLMNNTASGNYKGICLFSSSNNTLTNNTADSNNFKGIYLDSSSNNNMLMNNTVSGSNNGIYLDSSSNNTLTNNTIDSNNYCGIHLYSSSNNTFMNNTADSNNGHGINLRSSSNNNMFTNNTADSNNYYGIHLWSSSSNTLTNNTASGNDYGICLDSSSNNMLTNNIVNSNTKHGIYLYFSRGNTIYNNHFNNTNNAYDNGINIWNTTPTLGTNIIGGSWLGGNYWSDYSGADTTGDGLGDTRIPYNSSGNIQNGGDHHPLVQSVPSPDTTSPVVTNITNSTPTTNSITIIWNTDENSNSLVKYGTVQSNYTDAVLDTVMVSAHNITLSGLTTNTTYYFVVNSTDASNNSAQSEELNFTTATTITPSFVTVAIENVTLAPGESITVPIMVNNADDLGGCKINITYDVSVVHVTGVLQGDMDYLTYNIDNGTGWMTANALNDSGLNGNAVFANIKLNAVGIKGEETLLDITVDQLIDTGFNPIDHTVIDGIFIIEADTEAPLVIDASASPDTILNDNGRHRAPGTNTTTLSVMVTDADSGVANVTIDLSSIGGSADEPMIRVGDTDVRTVTVNAVAGINLTHHLTVNATDNKGNFNDSVSITLTVLRRGDVCRNNIIDSNDVIYIARYLAGLEPECSNPPSVLVADVVGLSGDAKGDSIVNLMDVLYLARYTAGLGGEP